MAKLRGVKPSEIKKRFKALFFGPAGAGKTTAAIQMPVPYLIDTERGAENPQYVKLLNQSGGSYFFTTDPDELITEVGSLLQSKHDFRTVIIDPLTVPYNDLIDKFAIELGTDFGRHKGPADRKIKHLLALLTRLDMNVIITSHAKPKWIRSKDAKGKDIITEDGQTFDCYGRLEYLFDLVIEIQKRGKDRVGIVRKTRIDTFPEGDTFVFTYDEIANRYGREALEKEAEPQTLATVDQVAQLNHLIHLLSFPNEEVQKWLAKAGAESFAEMPADAAQKCINFLLAMVKPESNGQETTNGKKGVDHGIPVSA